VVSLDRDMLLSVACSLFCQIFRAALGIRRPWRGGNGTLDRMMCDERQSHCLRPLLLSESLWRHPSGVCAVRSRRPLLLPSSHHCRLASPAPVGLDHLLPYWARGHAAAKFFVWAEAADGSRVESQCRVHSPSYPKSHFATIAEIAEHRLSCFWDLAFNRIPRASATCSWLQYQRQKRFEHILLKM